MYESVYFFFVHLSFVLKLLSVFDKLNEDEVETS